MTRSSLAAAAVSVALLTVPASAQTAPRPLDPPVLLVGIEAQHDRFQYHFDNPSSIDTASLVPHFFEQTYWADHVSLVVTGRYTAGARWESSVAVGLPNTNRADDYDTFIDPGNVVLVAGTTGDASMRAYRISQSADIGGSKTVRLSLGYRLRWDRFDYGPGHRTTTRDGVLIAESDTTAPELTDSRVHGVFVGFRTSPAAGRNWHVELSGDISPFTIGRLSVRLPEKYPGQDLVFHAQLATASGRVALVRAGRWPIECAVQLEHAWSYSASSRLSRPSESVSVSAGRSWR